MQYCRHKATRKTTPKTLTPQREVWETELITKIKIKFLKIKIKRDEHARKAKMSRVAVLITCSKKNKRVFKDALKTSRSYLVQVS